MFASCRQLFLNLIIGLGVIAPPVQAQIDTNFPDRKAIVINNAPFLELSGLNYANKYENRGSGLP